MLLAMDVGNTEPSSVSSDPRRRKHPTPWASRAPPTSAAWRFTGGSPRSRTARRTNTRWCSRNYSISRPGPAQRRERDRDLLVLADGHTQLRRMANRWFSTLDFTVIGPGTKSGMPILYDNPREVGPDRIADAVGAYDLYPGASIVVDLGPRRSLT